MKKLSGWQKVGLFAGIGCFSFVALLVVGFAMAVFYAKSTLADLGDTTPTQVERTHRHSGADRRGTASVREAPLPDEAGRHDEQRADAAERGVAGRARSTSSPASRTAACRSRDSSPRRCTN